jgi:hypothetical protein
VIYDRREMAESDDVSQESMKKFMPILNDYYPETLRAFYVLGASFFYRAAWTIVSIFVSKRTEQKINLFADEKDILLFITPDNLDQEYGGTLKIEDVGRIIPLKNH